MKAARGEVRKETADEINLEEQIEAATLAGFRLQRLEVLNWGTFNQRPWSIDLSGGTALLTGANGSGKSTLVDALLTLLVPNRTRNYNQASGTERKKKERNEKSYVQGAYARTRSEESYGSKSKFLREKGEISVLLAYFADADSEKDVSLAQVLWIDKGSVRKFYAIADMELKMEYFTACKEIALLKRNLKANDIEIFDNFSKYTQQFRKRFGLASEKALDLFNQTVSIKQIDGLNTFVRNHMLEAADMREKIEGLISSYENLTISHNAIQKAREQLEILTPLKKDATKIHKLEREIAHLERSVGIVSAFFAAQKLDLLEAALQGIEQALAKTQSQKESCDHRLSSQRKQAQDIAFAIQNDSVGQQIQALTVQIEQAEETLKSRQAAAKSYNRLAKQLKLSAYSDRDTFYASRGQGDELASEIEAALSEIVTQRDDLKVEQAELNKSRQQLDTELTSLRSRRSQIPKRNLDIRDRLLSAPDLQALDLQESDLPFAGELLQVRSEEKAWEGAIERLLRSFGLCLLVPETHYKAVNAYVNKTDLRGRLVYYKVAQTAPNQSPNYSEQANSADYMPGKVQVKQDDVFFEWLRSRLTKQFNYVCCGSLEQFQREQRAITSAGLIKHGQGRHEKDDSFRISQRSRYILGWDNADKIKALESELKEVNQQLSALAKQVNQLDQQRRNLEQQKSWLQDFIRFTDFSEVDWQSIDQQRQELLEKKQQLAASSNQLKQLEKQLQAIREEIQKTSDERDQTNRTIGNLENQRGENQKAQAQCKLLLEKVNTDALETFAQQQAKKLKTYSLTLDTIADEASAMKDYLQAQLRKQEKKRDGIENEIVKTLIKFKQNFAAETLEFSSNYQDLPAYLGLQAQIEKDDLPRHEKRFKQLMNEKVIIAISMFKSDLEKQEEEIEQAIDSLNESLRQIAYTDATFIELCCAKTKHREIRDFKESLRVCLGDVAKQSPEDQEERFRRIRGQLIERFKSEDRWTKLVTDVRNWLDFSVSERYREDEVEKEHHTDSSGKSGGQKVKLAYTILASAIAYQYGLTKTESTGFDGIPGLTPKSFRFVVIDEAFSRSDDDNARYAMKLFEELALQLLVITPKDKINVIESYIDTLHFVSNSAEGNYSKVISVSIEDFQQKHRSADPASVSTPPDMPPDTPPDTPSDTPDATTTELIAS